MTTEEMWDAASGVCARVLRGHTAQVSALAVCAASQTALSTSLDGTLRRPICGPVTLCADPEPADRFY